MSALALALLTAGLFARALQNDFVELDDTAYVTKNQHVRQGITAESLAWVRSAIVVGNWHPVTMLSHLLDVQLYGLAPWGHHLTSVLLHSANTALVFVLLWRLTGQGGAALAAALLFGWHPQRVESVAWVAERKDVLSGFFGLLALWSYVEWTKAPRRWRYALTLVLLAVGLMAKPMLVTLPCVMLLLDYWPLGRLRSPEADGEPGTADWSRLPGLIIEKLPLFALTILFSLITYGSQQQVVRISSPNLLSRLAISALAYVDYLNQFIVPQKLAAYYPQSVQHMTGGPVLVSAAVLGIATLSVAILSRGAPYLAVGWCWFLGMLVPVIGIVKVGEQARADRYMYLPSIGIGVIVAWALAEWSQGKPARQRLAAAGLGVWLACLAGLTWRQIGTWRDSEALYRHAASVTQRNAVAMNGLGHALMEKGQLDEALASLDQALEWAPRFGIALCSKAYTLQHLGRYEEAESYYVRMLDAGQNGPTERINYGRLLLDMGKYREARTQFDEAQRVAPERSEATVGLAAAAVGMGKWADAIGLYQQVLEAQSDNAAALSGLARVYSAAPAGALRRPGEAVRLAKKACELTGNRDPQLLDVYALSLAAAGKYAQAADAAKLAREQAVATVPQTPLLERLIADLEQREAAYRRGRME